eukprot:TCALIF_13285-PA protein Name:"Protein of unknown function" AED:0.54 eAED:0.54 QI:0/0/0/0.5/1/1/2/0/369
MKLIPLIVNGVPGDLRDSSRRDGRQVEGNNKANNGRIDFSNAVLDPESGKRCVIKNEEVQSLEKEPILECDHKNVEKCHYTYVTQFKPAQEEVCEENFEKVCQITFKQQATNETIQKCYRPLEKLCNGQGPEECRTVFESSCTTRYIEKQPGKFVGDTKCEKLPIEICGAGCVSQEGPEECHNKVITSLIDVPEEVCDLNPQKTCRLQTKLVPSLKPEHECTLIPQEICNLRFTSPKLKKKPLVTKWCLDDSPTKPGETYDEANAQDRPLALRGGRAGRTFIPRQLPIAAAASKSVDTLAVVAEVAADEQDTPDVDYDLEETTTTQAPETTTQSREIALIDIDETEALPYETQNFDAFVDVGAKSSILV